MTRRPRRNIPFGFVAALSVVIIAALAIWIGYGTFVGSFNDAQQAYEIRRNILRLESLVLDQETGIRGYSITGDRSFLQPYLNSKSTIPATLRELDALVASAPDAGLNRPYHDLNVAYQTWSREVAEPLVSSVPRTDATPLQRRGKTLVDGMRRDIAIMLLDIDSETATDSDKVRSAVLASVIAPSLLVAVLLGLTLALERRRRIAEGEGKLFFDAASDMLCVASYSGYFLRLNPAWTRVLGYSSEELMGLPLVDFIHPEDVKRTSDAMARLGDNEPVIAFHNRYRAKDGTYRSLVWNATPDLSQRLIYASARDETERIKLEIEIAELSLTDVLTGLPNRRSFLQQLEEAVAVARRYKLHCSVLFIDLDGFKAINDTLGHAKGDVVLQQMASAMRGALRQSDLLARLGGDEFAVLLPPVPTLHDSENVASKIVQSISGHVSTMTELAPISVSVGIAEFPRDCADGKDLLVLADAAMYAAKRKGGGSFVRHQTA